MLNQWAEHLLERHLWVQLAALFLGSFLVVFLLKGIRKRFLRQSHHTVWRAAWVDAFYTPLLLGVWLFVLTTMLILMSTEWHWQKPIAAIVFFQELGGVLLGIWALNRAVSRFEQAYLAHDPKLDKTTLNAIAQVLRILIVIIGLLIFMQSRGMKLSAILAVGGFSGIAVGFAAKDLLANFFGGLMIYMDRPFKVGDWVRSPDRNIEGVVEYIGWRATRIRTFDKRPLYVPNSTFLTISVENPSRMRNRRIKTYIGLRYQDAPKLKAILSDIEHMLKNHPEIDQTQTLMVHLVKFADSALEFMVYTFTKITQWTSFQAIQQDIFLKIIEIVHKHDADFAFPSRSLYMETPESPLEPPKEELQ